MDMSVDSRSNGYRHPDCNVKGDLLQLGDWKRLHQFLLRTEQYPYMAPAPACLVDGRDTLDWSQPLLYTIYCGEDQDAYISQLLRRKHRWLRTLISVVGVSCVHPSHKPGPHIPANTSMAVYLQSHIPAHHHHTRVLSGFESLIKVIPSRVWVWDMDVLLRKHPHAVSISSPHLQSCKACTPDIHCQSFVSSSLICSTGFSLGEYSTILTQSMTSHMAWWPIS